MLFMKTIKVGLFARVAFLPTCPLTLISALDSRNPQQCEVAARKSFWLSVEVVCGDAGETLFGIGAEVDISHGISVSQMRQGMYKSDLGGLQITDLVTHVHTKIHLKSRAVVEVEKYREALYALSRELILFVYAGKPEARFALLDESGALRLLEKYFNERDGMIIEVSMMSTRPDVDYGCLDEYSKHSFSLSADDASVLELSACPLLLTTHDLLECLDRVFRSGYQEMFTVSDECSWYGGADAVFNLVTRIKRGEKELNAQSGKDLARSTQVLASFLLSLVFICAERLRMERLRRLSLGTSSSGAGTLEVYDTILDGLSYAIDHSCFGRVHGVRKTEESSLYRHAPFLWRPRRLSSEHILQPPTITVLDTWLDPDINGDMSFIFTRTKRCLEIFRKYVGLNVISSQDVAPTECSGKFYTALKTLSADADLTLQGARAAFTVFREEWERTKALLGVECLAIRQTRSEDGRSEEARAVGWSSCALLFNASASKEGSEGTANPQTPDPPSNPSAFYCCGITGNGSPVMLSSSSLQLSGQYRTCAEMILLQHIEGCLSCAAVSLGKAIRLVFAEERSNRRSDRRGKIELSLCSLSNFDGTYRALDRMYRTTRLVSQILAVCQELRGLLGRFLSSAVSRVRFKRAMGRAGRVLMGINESIDRVREMWEGEQQKGSVPGYARCLLENRALLTRVISRASQLELMELSVEATYLITAKAITELSDLENCFVLSSEIVGVYEEHAFRLLLDFSRFRFHLIKFKDQIVSLETHIGEPPKTIPGCVCYLSYGKMRIVADMEELCKQQSALLHGLRILSLIFPSRVLQISDIIKSVADSIKFYYEAPTETQHQLMERSEKACVLLSASLAKVRGFVYSLLGHVEHSRLREVSRAIEDVESGCHLLRHLLSTSRQDNDQFVERFFVLARVILLVPG